MDMDFEYTYSAGFQGHGRGVLIAIQRPSHCGSQFSHRKWFVEKVGIWFQFSLG
jgi:hypothetical protein